MAPKSIRSSHAPLRVSSSRTTDLVPASASSSAVAVVEKRQVIQACGRTLAIPSTDKVEDVLHLLQSELGMPDQIFDLKDCHGQRLVLDSELQLALQEGRVPLAATLQDSAIHFIENRREELGQMQWKLVRDQHNQAQAKLNAFQIQLRELESSVETSRASIDRGLEQMRYELQRATEMVQESARADCRSVGERISGVSQNLNAEKNMREVSIQQVNKAIQGIRDAMDMDRSQYQESLRVPLSHISELRQLVDRERSAREATEDRHAVEVQGLRDRMDELSVQMRELMHEYGRKFEKASVDTTEALEVNRKHVTRARADTETFTSETNARVASLEERCQLLEQRLQEAQERQSESLQRMHQRNEKFALTVEQSRFDSQDSKGGVAEVAQKVDQLLERLQITEENVSQAHEKERQVRDSEMRNLRDHMISEYNKLLQSQENRLVSRIEVESAQRQDSTNQVLQNVNSMLKNQPDRADSTLARSVSAMISAPAPAPEASLARSSSTVIPAYGGSASVAPLVRPAVPTASPVMLPVARSMVAHPAVGPGSPVARVSRYA